MSDTNDRSGDRGGPLARPSSPGGAPWSGRHHRDHGQHHQPERPKAGLPAAQVALDLYTEGFKAGLTEKDPGDKAIVLRGRTVLKAPELERCLRPMLRFLRVGPDSVSTRVFDGQFEVRVAAAAAEAGESVQGAARSVLLMWIAGGLLGWWLRATWQVGTMLVWGITLLLGAVMLRRSLVSGRTMLAAKLAVGLGILAHEEQLILPPGDGSSGGSRPA